LLTQLYYDFFWYTIFWLSNCIEAAVCRNCVCSILCACVTYITVLVS